VPITATPSATIITGRGNIELFRLLTLKARLKLEMLGLKFKGRTAYSLLKRELQLDGNRKSVLLQVEQLLERHYANPGAREVQ
jgi:hypothetical protein